MERTIGVDLAVDPRDTAAVVIVWGRDGAEVRAPMTRCEDADLLDLLSALVPADRAGIDCPFGWPTAFVEAVAAHSHHQPWPGRAGWAEHYARLRSRTTDRVVRDVLRGLGGRGPLTVSMDKLGATAARWAYLADQLAAGGRPVDRSGAGQIVEVYPAGTRVVWGLTGDRSTRALLQAAPWLDFAPGVEQTCQDSEHAFDALIAALAARAAALGLTALPDGDQSADAAAEGWIHLPRPGSTASLGSLITAD